MPCNREACNVSLAAEDAPFTEEGYKTVAAGCEIHSKVQTEAMSQQHVSAEQHISVSECDKIMTIYIQRFAQQIRCSILDPLELQGFVIWYSGHRAVQSLAKLRDELHTLSWTSCGLARLSPLQQNIVQLRASANTYAVGFVKSVPSELLQSAEPSKQWQLLTAAVVLPILIICLCLKGRGFYAQFRSVFSRGCCGELQNCLSPSKRRTHDISVMSARQVEDFHTHDAANVVTCASRQCSTEDYVELT